MQRTTNLGLIICVSFLGACNATVQIDPAAQACEGDAQCADAFRCDAGRCVALDDEPDSCRSNEQCTRDHGGLPHVCRDQGSGPRCVGLYSEDCYEVSGYDNALHDDAVVLGVWTSPDQTRTLVHEGASLALQDFEDVGGVPLSLHGRVAPALLWCSGDDPARAVSHMVDEVGVPVVLWHAFEDLDLVADTFAQPGGTAFLHARTPGAATLDLAADRLVWTLRPSLAAHATALARHLPDYAASLRAARGEPATAAVDVHTVSRADRYHEGTEGRFEAAATWNIDVAGVTTGDAADNGALGHYQRSQIDEAPGPAAARVLEDAPDIVVLPVGDDDALELVDLVESQWPSSFPRPWWLVVEPRSDAHLGDVLSTHDAHSEGQSDAATRLTLRMGGVVGAPHPGQIRSSDRARDERRRSRGAQRNGYEGSKST